MVCCQPWSIRSILGGRMTRWKFYVAILRDVDRDGHDKVASLLSGYQSIQKGWKLSIIWRSSKGIVILRSHVFDISFADLTPVVKMKWQVVIPSSQFSNVQKLLTVHVRSTASFILRFYADHWMCAETVVGHITVLTKFLYLATCRVLPPKRLSTSQPAIAFASQFLREVASLSTILKETHKPSNVHTIFAFMDTAWWKQQRDASSTVAWECTQVSLRLSCERN